MNDDTRTARERAEELAADEWRRDEAISAEAERQTPFDGWQNVYENAALQRKFIDGANWQAARDAEPTTVTAEQIENAARTLYDDYERVDPGEQNPWSCFWDVGKEPYLQQTRAAFRAAGFRIEGDPA